jgi:hypothetical protein
MSSVVFSTAVATFTEVTWDPSKMIDGDFTGAQGNGWSVFNFDTGSAEAADALLTLASPLPAGHYSLTFTIYQNYWNPGHILGDFALDYTTAASPTLSSPQTPVSILSVSSLNGTTFSLLSPGELLANTSNNSLGTDTYTITAFVDSASPITGIFLDAIKNPSLPGGGPGGQYPNGNFVVSELTLDAIAAPVINTTAPAQDNAVSINIVGTAEALSTVTLYNGASVVGTTAADGSGNWHINGIALTDGIDYSFTATATDAATNTSGPSNALAFHDDQTPPAVTESLVSDTGSSSTDKITSNPALTGSGDPNAWCILPWTANRSPRRRPPMAAACGHSRRPV